jgi:hypothetical protein
MIDSMISRLLRSASVYTLFFVYAGPDVGEEWFLLRRCLTSKQLIPDKLVGETGYIAQCTWWTLNGMKFGLIDRHPELRVMVFEYALGPRQFGSKARGNTARDCDCRFPAYR